MGRGGVRYGAGRPGWRPKAEACLRLDVRDFARRKLLRPGTFGWHWTNKSTGEQVGSIQIQCNASAMELHYSLSGEPKVQRVPLSRTSCTFGGLRDWLHCPSCGRRAAILYMTRGRFCCRCCGRVSYSSQSEDLCGRTWRRQAKLEARLEEDCQRPKGMHRATYKRILSSIFDCEEVRETALAAFMDRHWHLLQ
jgi:hypothetical protein